MVFVFNLSTAWDVRYCFLHLLLISSCFKDMSWFHVFSGNFSNPSTKCICSLLLLPQHCLYGYYTPIHVALRKMLLPAQTLLRISTGFLIGRMKKFWQQIVLMVAQHCECTSCYRIAHLKTITMVSLMVYIFYHQKQNKYLAPNQKNGEILLAFSLGTREEYFIISTYQYCIGSLTERRKPRKMNKRLMG